MQKSPHSGWIDRRACWSSGSPNTAFFVIETGSSLPFDESFTVPVLVISGADFRSCTPAEHERRNVVSELICRTNAGDQFGNCRTSLSRESHLSVVDEGVRTSLGKRSDM